MKAYKRAPNCGPVPYPDCSGNLLHDEVVTGDGWEPLVALGFVVPVEQVVKEDDPGTSKPEAKSVLESIAEEGFVQDLATSDEEVSAQSEPEGNANQPSKASISVEGVTSQSSDSESKASRSSGRRWKKMNG